MTEKLSTTVMSGVRFEAEPDVSLRKMLPSWIGCQRAIYNAKVEEDKLFAAQWRAEQAKRPSEKVVSPLDQQYAHFKHRELTPWLYDVPSQVLRNGAYRWMTAKQKQLKGLAKAPRKRNPSNFDSVLLTSELFRFIDDKHGRVDKFGNPVRLIRIGTESRLFGFIRFEANRAYALPKTLTIRRTAAGKWYVSFNFDETLTVAIRSEAELAYELNGLSDEALETVTVGIDRNVSANRLATSNGRFYDFKDIEKDRLARKEKRIRKYQRKMARQQLGSANYRKTARKVAKMQNYGGNVRRNFAHQTSHRLVEADFKLYVFEDLNIQGMTKRPRPKKDEETGKWMRNGRRAKAGLAKSILSSAWGLTEQFLKYKAARRNALVVFVPAKNSSRECRECGHTAKLNRRKDKFICVSCGHADHADVNASSVIKKRGVALIRSRRLEEPTGKVKRKTSFRKKVVQGGDTSGLFVETREDQNLPVGESRHPSLKRSPVPSPGNPDLNAPC